MSTAPMMYRELPASPPWQEIIASFWEFVAGCSLQPGHLHTIPVDGCASIGYVRSKDGSVKTVFVGPRIQALKVSVTPGDRFWGIRFLPGASRAAIGKTGAEWRDKIGLLDFELPAIATELRSRLATISRAEEAVPVLESLLTPSEPCPIVAAGVLSITASRGSVRIADLPARAGVSERQFLRRFREEVGLTPKQYARICRFRTAAIEALRSQGANWGEIAAGQGFADQAHLTHEFQQLFGVSPREFETQFLTRIEHGPLFSR